MRDINRNGGFDTILQWEAIPRPGGISKIVTGSSPTLREVVKICCIASGIDYDHEFDGNWDEGHDQRFLLF